MKTATIAAIAAGMILLGGMVWAASHEEGDKAAAAKGGQGQGCPMMSMVSGGGQKGAQGGQGGMGMMGGMMGGGGQKGAQGGQGGMGCPMMSMMGGGQGQPKADEK